MPTQINGLPAHVLLIHAIVILIPLGALFTVLSAVWPAAHRKLGFLAPLACLIGVVLVPVTTNAGEWLEEKIAANGEVRAIEKHAELGDAFLWYAILLFVVSAAVWWLGRSYRWQVLPGRSENPRSPRARHRARAAPCWRSARGAEAGATGLGRAVLAVVTSSSRCSWCTSSTASATPARRRPGTTSNAAI